MCVQILLFFKYFCSHEDSHETALLTVTVSSFDLMALSLSSYHYEMDLESENFTWYLLAYLPSVWSWRYTNHSNHTNSSLCISMVEETEYKPLELCGNIILVKQIGKNYVNYKALSKVLFTHTQRNIHSFSFLHTIFISPIFWLKEDSITNEYLILP